MNILVLEDEEDFYQELSESIRRLAGNHHQPIEITRASYAEQAISLFDEQVFDFFIVDRNVPIRPSSGASARHGDLAVHKFSSIAPGSPVLVLSAHNDPEITQLMGDLARRQSLWGVASDFRMVQYRSKLKLQEALSIIEEVINYFSLMDRVEVEGLSGKAVYEVGRAVKVFASIQGASRIVCREISGGLSGSSVHAVELFNSQNVVFLSVVCKIGDRRKLGQEHNNYVKYVQRLPNSLYANLMDDCSVFMQDRSAIFYNLQTLHDKNLFDIILTDQSLAASVVQSLRLGFGQWADVRAKERRTIADIRRCILDDDRFDEICSRYSLSHVQAFEALPVNTGYSIQHRDLHGGNVLVSRDGAHKIIDFGDVGEAPACFDPLYLELSILFHPEFGGMRDWVTEEAISSWFEDQSYPALTPFPDFINACRDWLRSNREGMREVYATVYAICIKQLKYTSETAQDHQLKLALLNTAISLGQAC